MFHTRSLLIALVVALGFCTLATTASADAVPADELPAPSVTTLPTTGVTGTTATFHATVATNNTATTGYFMYGTAPDQLTSRTPDVSLVAGSGEVAMDAAVAKLSLNAKYYVVAVAENGDWVVTGGLESFSTLAPPAILGGSVSDITYKSATLHLNVVTHGQPVTVEGSAKSESWIVVRNPGEVLGHGGGVKTLFGPYLVTADGDVAIPLDRLETGAEYAWSAKVTSVVGDSNISGRFHTAGLITMPRPTVAPAVATYGSHVQISGTIVNKPGLVVTLAEQAYPFSGPIGPLAGRTATTDATGAYTFDLLAERPAAYGVTADGALALVARNLAKLRVAPAVIAKAKRARRHRFVVAGSYQPAIASKVSLYRRGAGRVGIVRTSRGSFRFPARTLKPGNYEVRVTPAVSTGFERAKSVAIAIPRR